MKQEDYASLDAFGLSALVRSGAVTPQEAVLAALDVIGRRNPDLNAVVLLDEERALTEAERVDRSAPLAGVPILIKDNNLHVEGWPTTYGSKFFAGAPPRPESDFIVKLRRAGAILVGKTNLPEFAADWTTEPSFRGVSRNPWDLSRSPGGSSGGSAAAVASGMVPIAHGNDNAGSIRVPAAVCGLFGFKPTRGLTNAEPYFGELANGHNAEFALTRSVRDAALLLDVLAGPDSRARYQVARTVPSYLAALDQSLEPLRVGLVLAVPGGVTDPEIAAAAERVARLLASRGGSVTAINLPPLDEVLTDSETMWALDALVLIKERETEIGRAVRPDELEALTRHVIARVSRLTATDLMMARQRLHAFSRRALAAFGAFDAIITPTTAQTALPIGHFDSRTAAFSYDEFSHRSAAFAPFTEIFNITGQPAASVPAGFSTQGLPMGVQIAAPAGRDDLVLRAARLICNE